MARELIAAQVIGPSQANPSELSRGAADRSVFLGTVGDQDFYLWPKLRTDATLKTGSLVWTMREGMVHLVWSLYGGSDLSQLPSAILARVVWVHPCQ